MRQFNAFLRHNDVSLALALEQARALTCSLDGPVNMSGRGEPCANISQAIPKIIRASLGLFLSDIYMYTHIYIHVYMLIVYTHVYTLYLG